MSSVEYPVVTGTNRFINKLTSLKEGELGILRSHAGTGLDESVSGFDLFTGLWWGLRKDNKWAPEREVAWLVSKLYARNPFEHRAGYFFADQLRISVIHKNKKRVQAFFDSLLLSSISNLENFLSLGLRIIAQKNDSNNFLDWVQLTNDLSNWNLEKTRQKWSNQFLNI